MISQRVLGIKQSMPADPAEHCQALQAIFQNESVSREMRALVPEELFIIVHSIDGLALRNTTAQLVLARLASIPQIRMLASIDHVNAPLLWNHIMVGQFNWIWHDTTTFDPYICEGEANFALKSFGKTEVQSGHKSVRYVLSSVPLNSKRIFKLLATTQLQKIKEMKELGKVTARMKAIPLGEFSVVCEQNLLAGGRDALKGHLREFLDHKIIKKTGSAGEEMIFIDMSEKELLALIEGELAGTE